MEKVDGVCVTSLNIDWTGTSVTHADVGRIKFTLKDGEDVEVTGTGSGADVED